MTNKETLDAIEAFHEGQKKMIHSSYGDEKYENPHMDYLISRVRTLTAALEFYSIRARYEWSSNGGLLGESLIQDYGSLARKALSDGEE